MVINIKINKILKGCFLHLVESYKIAMAINVSKVLVEYWKGSILDLVECCLHLSDVFYFSGI